jgi:hypothetical protein
MDIIIGRDMDMINDLTGITPILFSCICGSDDIIITSCSESSFTSIAQT